MPAQQNTLISNSNGLADDMDIDTVNSKIKRRPNSKSGLVEFQNEFEQMSKIERTLFHDDVQQAYETASKEIDDILSGMD